jgi:cell division protein FtsL
MLSDASFVWNLILSVAVGSFVWWMRNISLQISTLRGSISDTREEIAKAYVTKDDLHQDMKELMKRFDRLEEKFERFITSRLE